MTTRGAKALNDDGSGDDDDDDFKRRQVVPIVTQKFLAPLESVRERKDCAEVLPV